MRHVHTFLPFASVVRGLDKTVGDVAVWSSSRFRVFGRWGGIVSTWIVAEIVHTDALPHIHAGHAISEADAKQPHPSIRARSCIVAVMATVRAPPGHLIMLQGCQPDWPASNCLDTLPASTSREAEDPAHPETTGVDEDFQITIRPFYLQEVEKRRKGYLGRRSGGTGFRKELVECQDLRAGVWHRRWAPVTPRNFPKICCAEEERLRIWEYKFDEEIEPAYTEVTLLPTHHLQEELQPIWDGLINSARGQRPLKLLTAAHSNSQGFDAGWFRMAADTPKQFSPQRNTRLETTTRTPRNPGT